MGFRKLLSLSWPFVVLVILFGWTLAGHLHKKEVQPFSKPLIGAICWGRAERAHVEIEKDLKVNGKGDPTRLNRLLSFACEQYAFSEYRHKDGYENDQSVPREAIIRDIVKQGANMRGVPLSLKVPASGYDEYGCPLAYAVVHDSIKLYRLLRSFGADPKTPNRFGPTLFFALEEPGHKGQLPSEHDADIIDALLKDGVDMTVRDASGRTIAHYAAAMFTPRIMRCLIKRGIDVNVKDRMGITPLDCVKDRDMKEMMIQAGAKPGGPL